MSDYVLKNVTIIDGTLEAKEYISDIYVKDGKIAKIGDCKDLNVEQIDLTGKYVIPGLINLHAHLPASGKAGTNPAKAKKLVKFLVGCKLMHGIGVKLEAKYSLQELQGGVTTVRSVGGIGHFDTILRNKINSGKIIGPRVLASDYAICPTNGHMEGTVSVKADTPEDAVRLVDDLHNAKVDLVKLMITGGVLDAKKKGEPGILKMDPTIIKAACDRAHSYGLPVAAHVESPEGVKVALENGVDTIEHGASMDEETIKLYKEHNAAMVATFSPAVADSALDSELTGADDFYRYNVGVVALRIFEGCKKAIAEGIKLGLGNDVGCPRVYHYDFWREIEYFAHMLHLDRKVALSYATLQNAKIVNLDNTIGSIEEGKIADLVVTDKSISEGFNTLKQPYMVIKDGKVLKNKIIKRNLDSDKILDQVFEIDPEKAMNDFINNHQD